MELCQTVKNGKGSAVFQEQGFQTSFSARGGTPTVYRLRMVVAEHINDPPVPAVLRGGRRRGELCDRIAPREASERRGAGRRENPCGSENLPPSFAASRTTDGWRRVLRGLTGRF